MRKCDEFELDLQCALQQRVAEMAAPEHAEERLLVGIANLQAEAELKQMKKERFYMKKFSVKLVATVCAVFALSAVSVLAASGVLGGWVGHNIIGSRVSSYAQMTEKLLPELDYAPQTVDEFANGFAFSCADLGEFQAMDDEGNKFGRVYKNLMLEYENADGEQLVLYISNEPNGEPAPGVVCSAEVDGVLLEYREMQYLFVPPGYDVSEEDRVAEARGEMYISVGSSEVERKLNRGVQWQQGGVNYNLFGWDLALGADEMLNMAAEVLAAE